MNLQKLLTLRSGHRNVITRQLEKIDEAKKDPTLTDFHTILETIQQKARAIEPLNEKILSLTDINNIEEELMNSEEYSLDLEIKLKHLKIFGNKQSRNDVENSNSRDDSTMHGNSGNTRDDPLSIPSFQRTASFASSNSQFYRLPKLTIPTFNGDILKWQTFWDSYESTVHTNINLTDVQKFSYLQSQLDGDAARTIDGFPLSNAKYAKAVQLLIERFGQPHKITHAYMQSLIQLPAPSSNINSLRNFYDKLEAFIRGLESLGKNQDSFGSLLVPVIIDNWPESAATGTGVYKTCELQYFGKSTSWRLEMLRSFHQTAVAPVCSNKYCTEANILFDEGAQRSFITEKLAKDLHLIPDGTDVVTLATFGKTKKNTRSLDTATVYVKTEHGTKILITVLIVPMIATLLNNRYRENVMNMPYLKKLKFAHPVSSDDNFEILLLIGADFYWSLIQDNIIRGNGPTAVQSRLGYLITYRFKSVLFGATSSPFILNATILKHLSENHELPVSNILKRDLYIDDILSSLKTEEDAIDYFRESRTLMSKAGFNLRSWTSNSQRLQELAESEGVHDSDIPVKVLGMRWDPECDTLRFCKRSFNTTHDTTKRFILQESSNIFDPLGLLSPVTVRAKLLMQDLWKEHYTWDSSLPDSIRQKWESIAKDLDKATNVTFPRLYFPLMNNKERNTDDIILHVFVDASELSYGAVAYLCHSDQTTLIMAKNRIAPFKKITLPRLELMAAVIGARFATHIQKSFNVSTYKA